MTALNDKIALFADKRVRKGDDTQAVAIGLLCAGITLLRDSNGDPRAEAIVTIEKGEAPTVKLVGTGQKAVLVPRAMLSPTRIEEYLDYATTYRAFDENTPNGATDPHDLGPPMNDFRRAAIVLLKKVLGQLPPDYVASTPDYSDVDLQALLDATQQSLTQFGYYADQHDAKGTPESAAKAAVNREFVQMCAAALGERANMAPRPPRMPQERDSGLPAPVEAGKLAAYRAKRDRREVLTRIDKLPDYPGLVVGLADLQIRLADFCGTLAAGRIVTELVEAYDAYCAEDMDDKLPDYPGLVVELANLQIRLADFCGTLVAGGIVTYEGAPNPDDEMFRETPEALGEPETGGFVAIGDVAAALIDKLAFDHKPEKRKQT